MNAQNRFTLTLICFGLLIAGGVLIKQQTVSSELAESQIVVRDYAQMNAAVEEVLEDMPEIVKELELIRSKVAKYEIDRLFSVKKAEFRIRVENNLTKQEHSSEFMQAMAEKEYKRYMEAMRIAKEEYGMDVTEEEVTDFIKQNVVSVRSEEKKKYAEALGLTLSELDYQFDRDFYVMDVLWGKVTPVVTETYPKQDGESESAYSERIKEEFFSRAVEDE